MVHRAIQQFIHEKLGEKKDQFLLPPPVFETMEGEFLDFDPEEKSLKTRFPVLQKFLNPYGSMQGGMVAAAVDNTIGPLSMLVAPPNVTRRLEMKFSRPITPDLEFILVEARLVEAKGQMLTFRAEVKDLKGKGLAKARAFHWIIERSNKG
jgi:acyl-coenzyme A thioesterase PaaI-like protein